MDKYGQTWWGQQWLNSLLHIDNDNRLPRGRSYASNGSVLSVTLNGNSISSKVQGSMRKPYDVRIAVPPFTKQQKALLKEAILNRPDLLSKLLNHYLSPDLDALAKKIGINIFPSTWKDFTMDCSCPDWAVPCKHLAAVIYMVANEIDKNPFIALELHGFDLLAELEEQHSNTGNTVSIPSIESLVEPLSKTATTAPAAMPLMDYSQIMSEQKLPNLLKPAPVFYPKDFKLLLENIYKEIPKEVALLELLSMNSSPTKGKGRAWLSFNAITGEHIIHETTSEGTQNHTVLECISQLLPLEDKHLPHLDYTWQYLHEVLLFTIHIAQKGTFIPGIYAAPKQGYNMRWTPAVMDHQVNHLFDQLKNAIPANMVQVQGLGKLPHTFTAQAEQLNQLVHAFLQTILSSAHQRKRLNAFWYEKNQFTPVLNLFIHGFANGFESFSLVQIPGSIHQWLSIFNIAAHRYNTIIKVEEHKKGFSLALLIEDVQQRMLPPIALSELFENPELVPHQLQILKDISLTADILPSLNEIIAHKGKKELVVSTQEFTTILLQTLPMLKMLGASVLLPKQLKSLIRPQLKMMLKKAEGSSTSVKSLVGLSQILDYSWVVAIGNEEISIEEFEKRVQNTSGLVKMHGGYLLLEESDIRSMKKHLESSQRLSQFDLLQAVLAEETNGIKAGLSPDVAKIVQSLLSAPAPAIPSAINATLRPYQIRGFEWLARNASLGMGSIIADDMGLGKTLQVITLLQHMKDNGLLSKAPAMVVAPTTLITNWQKEIARFASTLTAAIYHGNSRSEKFSNHEVIITSYGMVRNSLPAFEKQKWSAMVIDEAQNIKNPGTEQTKAVKKLKAEVRIAMSGTPVENRLLEYWSIFDFTNKGYLGNQKRFADEFAKPIHFNHDMERIAFFQRVTAPFILRRLKSDKSIIADLPDKVETNHLAQLTPDQAALYQSTVDSAIEQIENTEGIERKGLVLKMLTALKQIGNHPVQYLKKGEATLSASGKLQLAMQLVQSILESDGKMLIFTQYKEMGLILQQLIAQETGEQPLFLHGGLSRAQRDAMVEEFQNAPQTRIFILSLKAGGTGLNLTAATHVIHYDLWWNPAVEAQATDRAYRIGQHQNVMVYRLINLGTIEEKIDLMINEKRDLANLTVATGETWLGNLSSEEIIKLVSLEA